VISADPLNGNPPPDAATNAYDAVVAYEAVPVRSPTNDPLSVLTDPDATATNARTSIFDCDGGTSVKVNVELDMV
jgi:hypothetical protein